MRDVCYHHILIFFVDKEMNHEIRFLMRRENICDLESVHSQIDLCILLESVWILSVRIKMKIKTNFFLLVLILHWAKLHRKIKHWGNVKCFGVQIWLFKRLITGIVFIFKHPIACYSLCITFRFNALKWSFNKIRIYE